MAWKIDCPDGVTVRGETEEELLANAFAHIREAHADLVGKVTREDLLAQATQM